MSIIINNSNVVFGPAPIITPPSPPDPDATAFLTAAGITDPTITSAIDTLVKDLKTSGIWARSLALYPFVGGTAATHKWNLKDPRDLDAAYRLTFLGGMTHSSNGVLPNGVNAYARTYLNFNTTVFPEESSNLSYYSRSNILENASNGALLGAFGAIQPTWGNYLVVGNNNSVLGPISAYRAQFASTGGSVIDTDVSAIYSGFFQGNFLTNSFKLYRNNTRIGNPPSDVPRAMRDFECFLFCYSRQGTTVNFPTAKESAWAGITYGLTDTQILDYNNAIQTFQTTLGRNV